MATSGHNGNNETLIGNSSSTSLTLYDESNNEIPITKSNMHIDVLIQRSKNVSRFHSFQYVNATEINNEMSLNSLFLQNTFNIQSNNASIHVEILPINLNTSYLMILKLGHLPIVNFSSFDFTSFKIFCPSNNFRTKL